VTAPAVRRRGSLGGSRWVRLVAAALVAAVLTSCGGGSPVGSAGTFAAGALSDALLPTAPPSAPATSSAPDLPVPSASVPVTPPSATGPAVPVDPALLAILPLSVDGFPVRSIPDPTGLDDPALVANLARLAQAYVVDPAASGFAYASVVVLRPGVFSEAFFRSWRDSFDTGACSQAGGVAGHAQAQIGGRTAYLGTCVGGLLTYHVRLDSLNAIVSVSSLGTARLGEQLLAGLRA
jgi:hypothetical protein